MSTRAFWASELPVGDPVIERHGRRGGRLNDPITAGVGSVIGGVLGAGGSILGARKQASAAQSAANTQFAAAQAALDEQRRQFDINQANLQPWLRGGKQGLAALFPMLGIAYNPVTGERLDRIPDISKILARDPEYQFQLGEGLRALERSSAATTGTLNPRAVKALERYGQGLASNAYTNRYNRLASLAGLGQTTGTQMGQFGQNYAANQANLLGQQGNALAAGTIGGANAFTGGLLGVGNAANSFGQQYMLNQLLSRLAQPTTTPATAGSGWVSGYDLPMGGGLT